MPRVEGTDHERRWTLDTLAHDHKFSLRLVHTGRTENASLLVEQSTGHIELMKLPPTTPIFMRAKNTRKAWLGGIRARAQTYIVLQAVVCLHRLVSSFKETYLAPSFTT